MKTSHDVIVLSLVILAIVREEGTVPQGPLYQAAMVKGYDLEDFQTAIGRLKNLGKITTTNETISIVVE